MQNVSGQHDGHSAVPPGYPAPGSYGHGPPAPHGYAEWQNPHHAYPPSNQQSASPDSQYNHAQNAAPFKGQVAFEVPPKFVIWQKTDSNSNDHQSIGLDEKSPLLTGKVPMFSGRLILHDGDYKHEGREIARAERSGGMMSKGFVVRLNTGLSVNVDMERKGAKKFLFPFTMNIGGTEQTFYWKHEKGGFSQRLQKTGTYELRRKGEDTLLATFAIHGGMGSMTKRKMGDFEFLGDGLRMGPDFRLVAVTSAMRIKQKLENKAALGQFLGSL